MDWNVEWNNGMEYLYSNLYGTYKAISHVAMHSTNFKFPALGTTVLQYVPQAGGVPRSCFLPYS